MVPFTFVDFEREAHALVEQARAKAAAVLQQAMAEAANVKERARIEGLAEGLRDVERRRAELCAEAERDLVGLAVAIAERIVKAEVALGRPVAAANLKRAIELAAHRRVAIARVHPGDAGRLAVPGLVVEGDAAVTPGGVVLELREGRIDLDVRTQLDAIERGLIG